MSLVPSRSGALAVILASIAALAWTALELVQPASGFDDTDSPTVTLQFLALHRDIWASSGIVLLLLGIAMVVATFAVADLLAVRSGSLTVRSVSAAGLFAAGSFFMFGVLRSGAGPVLYLQGLREDWGQSAFLVIQMMGIHGFAQAALLGFCLWAAAISLMALRSGALPRLLCVLGVIPATRIAVLMLGATGSSASLPDGLWVLAMITIPGTFAWSLILGLVLLRRSLLGLGSEVRADFIRAT